MCIGMGMQVHVLGEKGLLNALLMIILFGAMHLHIPRLCFVRKKIIIIILIIYNWTYCC
jgi:hypothetical protein